MDGPDGHRALADGAGGCSTGGMSEVRPRPTSTTGYRVSTAFAVPADGVLLLLVHVWPGWEALSFLTGDTTRVLPFVDAPLVAGIAVGLL